MTKSRANVVSSFTVKYSLIDETYLVFQRWNFEISRQENLRRMREEDWIGATSANWLRDVSKIINRRFDPAGRDRPLVELAQSGCDREVWKPLLLWHMTRDEFLVRDFLTSWLYSDYTGGTYRIRTKDVVPYLRELRKRRDLQVSGNWSDTTTSRVASGLLRMAVDFDLMRGTITKEFASYHLPEESFLYLLHAMVENESNVQKIVNSPDWHLYQMDATDVERELLRLHQFRRLHYEVAGSLVRLDLPFGSTRDYARELMA